jgi:two-component system, OmpR family, sensor kinase
MAEDRQEKREEDKNPTGSGAGGFFKEVDVDFLVHELKDPVAVIEAGIRSLLERTDKFGPLTERQRRTLERSLRSARKAGNMLQELLEVGRGESGCFISEKFRPAEAVFIALMDAVETMSVELAELLDPGLTRQQIEEVLRGKNIIYEVSEEAKQIEIVQDQRKIIHIAGNLIKNALHHRKKRVEIKIEISPVGLNVSVCDDGPGVAPSFQQKIFQRYSQADACTGLLRNGHGLGLAGARALARCLGGDVFLESKKGHGAVFRFVMPLSSF